MLKSLLVLALCLVAGASRASTVTLNMSGTLSGASPGGLNEEIAAEFPLGTAFSAVLTYDDALPTADVGSDTASYVFAPGTWSFHATLGDMEVEAGDSLEIHLLNLDYEPLFGSVVGFIGVHSLASSGVGTQLVEINFRMLDLVLGDPFDSLLLTDVPSGLDQLAAPVLEWRFAFDNGDGPEIESALGASDSFTVVAPEPSVLALFAAALVAGRGFRRARS